MQRHFVHSYHRDDGTPVHGYSRGVLKVKLDDPDEYNKKYAPLTRDWRKMAQ